MKSFFQTFKQRNLLSASRIAGKKLSASVPLLLAALLTVVLYSCRDEDLFPSASVSEQNSNTRAEAENTSGLNVDKVQVSDGSDYKGYNGYAYYPYNRRIPLVGEGRVINQLTGSLVKVLGEENNLECLVDEVLENSVNFSGLADVSTFEAIISVKDLNRVYYHKDGIKVGFIYQESGSILNLDLLENLQIQTYLNGNLQDKSSVSDNNDGFNLLNLNILSVAGGLSEISFTTDKPFDEVRLVNASAVNLGIVSEFNIYYAFVGENPEKMATVNGFYDKATTYEGRGPLGTGNTKKLIDEFNWSDDNKNYEYLSPGLLGIAAQTELYVNFQDIAIEGSEIGFRTGGFKTLGLDLSGLIISELTASENGEWKETAELGSGIGLSLLGTSSGSMSAIANGDCYGVKIEIDGNIIEDLLDGLLGGLTDLLGTTHYYYAYSRDPVTVDPSAYFTIGNDVTYNDYYDLPQPTEGSVSYTVTSSSGANPSVADYRITGMEPGDYIVKADYTKDEETITSYAVITCKKVDVISGCNTKMINDATSQYKVVDPGKLGGISLFNKINNTDKLVDTDAENYAEATNALSLLQFGGLIGVESTQNISKPNGAMTRVGFVMQTNKQLLGADVLKYFYIVLYKDGEVVDEGISQQNKTVGVGLIGNNGDKLRFYMETEETFDRVELWTAGLLNVSLSTFRLYYAFYESTECDNNSATSEACMEVISAQNHGAKINYAETKLPSAVSVGSVMDNLSYVIDNSLETSATIIKGISLVDRTTIAVKFDYVNGGAVGAVLRSTPNILDVTALQNITVTAYNKGNAVTSEATSSGLVSIDLISDSGLAYLEINPELGFDEVRISFPSLANIADHVLLAGFYIRPDTDGDGIPDCAEEPDDQTTVKVSGWTKHVCIDPKTGEGIIDITLSGIGDGSAYTADLTCYPYNGSGQTVMRRVESTTASNGTAVLKVSLPVGDYSISGLPFNGLRAQVHPRKTTWKRNPSNTDWNNWNNWTNGSPWHCTNVVIPTGATQYPKLTAWSAVNEFWGGNYCSYIHFEPDAAVLNTHYLQYEGAYVEKILKGGNYYNVSMPLHGMVTGDMFISPEMPAYFTPLTPESYPEVRHNPVVRQRMWSKTVPYAISSSEGGTWAAVAEWSRTFNAVNQAYDRAQGFSMKVGDDSDLGISYRLRFPKDYDTYHYFTLGGVQTGGDVTITRKMEGRFVYEAYTGYDPRNGSGTVFNYSLKNENIESTEFVAGNPFMSYLDIRTLLAENAGTVSAIRLETDNGNVTYKMESGNLIVTGGEKPVDVIAPMQAFYVTASASGETASISYSEKMFVQPSSTVATRNSMTAMQSQPTAMNISLRSVDEQSGCIVLLNNKASDAYVPGEDVPLLIDRERMPKLKVFTLAESKALDIQQTNDSKEIELGFIAKGSQKGIMTLNAGSLWRGWCLVDVRTQTRYLLSGGSVDIEISNISDCNGRYYLVKQ